MDALWMQNDTELLYYRTLLCLLDKDENNRTVTAIAHKLDAEKYQISRILSSLKGRGILEQTEPRKPRLTMLGKQYLLQYEKRVNLIMEFLAYAGVNPTKLRVTSLYIAAHTDEEISSMIGEKLKKLHLIEQLRKTSYVDGRILCRILGDGIYNVSFLFLERPDQIENPVEIPKENGRMQATLSVKNGEGTIQIYSNVSAKGQTGMRIADLQYLRDGIYMSAETYMHLFCLPCEVFVMAGQGTTAAKQFGVSGIVNIRFRRESEQDYRQGLAMFFI